MALCNLKPGDLVRFAHERDGGPVHRVVRIDVHDMIELADMVGWFAPPLFVLADDIADIPPKVENDLCQCPTCGRMHKLLNAGKPPVAIAGPSLLRPAEKPYDYRCDCCDNGLNAEWDFCPWCGKIQREEPSGLCLAGLASNKACRPDDTLKRCTICGFVIDTKYAAEKPTTHLR